MFDKIFKTILLLILAFIAYTFYLYVANNRYHAINPRVILDRRTGKTYLKTYKQPGTKSSEDANYKFQSSGDPIIKSEADLRQVLLGDSTRVKPK